MLAHVLVCSAVLSRANHDACGRSFDVFADGMREWRVRRCVRAELWQGRGAVSRAHRANLDRGGFFYRGGGRG